jgi:hypothetical protein
MLLGEIQSKKHVATLLVADKFLKSSNLVVVSGDLNRIVNPTPAQPPNADSHHKVGKLT